MTAFSSALPLDLLPGLLEKAPAACPPEAELRLIRQAQEGSHAAFRTLVETHQGLIHGVCARWLSSADDADEVCQDTFLKAWQALPAWQPRARLSTWLCRIALNLCRDRAKSRAGRQRRLTFPLTGHTPVSPCPRATPDVAAARTGDMEKLRRGLAVLPPAMREVIILRGIEGLSQKETAAILRCSERAAEGRLHRARRLLLEWWTLHS